MSRWPIIKSELTEPQKNLLAWLREAGEHGRRVGGYDVRTATYLVSKGLVRHIRERWYAAVA